MMESDSGTPIQTHAAHEVHGELGHSSVMVICEHASNRVPPPLESEPSDTPMLLSHWGWDIGVREVGQAVVRELDAIAVMARFSRLVCDANRDPLQGTFIRSHVEDQPLSFNQNLDDAEIDRRTDEYHTRYHQAVHALIEERLRLDTPFLLLSIHSFTPVWGNTVRDLDFGVLFSCYDDIAEQLAGNLRGHGYRVALNQPYSAANGMAYSVERHGRFHRIPFLELEINQARLGTPLQSRSLGETLASCLKDLVIDSQFRTDH